MSNRLPLEYLSEQLKQCAKCENYRHVTQFRPYAIWCFACEAEDALDREIAEADDKDIAEARDFLNIHLFGKRSFDLGRSYEVQDRLKQVERRERIELWATLILDGDRPGFIKRKDWRVVQQLGDGKTALDVAGEEDLPLDQIREREASVMAAVVEYAAGIIDGTRAPIHVPGDHPRRDWLLKTLASEQVAVEVPPSGGGVGGGGAGGGSDDLGALEAEGIDGSGLPTPAP